MVIFFTIILDKLLELHDFKLVSLLIMSMLYSYLEPPQQIVLFPYFFCT